MKSTDLKITTYESSGRGFAPTTRGVAVTHLPSGMQVRCHSMSTTHGNRQACIQMLAVHFGELEVVPEQTPQEELLAAAKALVEHQTSSQFRIRSPLGVIRLMPMTLLERLAAAVERCQ